MAQDLDAAARLFDRACRGNDGDACASLGTAYLVGEGVAIDTGTAVELMQYSCKLGSAYGCKGMSLLIEQGIIVAAPGDAESYAVQAEALGTGAP